MKNRKIRVLALVLKDQGMGVAADMLLKAVELDLLDRMERRKLRKAFPVARTKRAAEFRARENNI